MVATRDAANTGVNAMPAARVHRAEALIRRGKLAIVKLKWENGRRQQAHDDTAF